MKEYFPLTKSIFHVHNGQVKPTLETIIKRYIKNHPPLPYNFRPYCTHGILRNADYRYEIDFNSRFPEAENEDFVYAWGKYWADQPGSLRFDITPFGPMVVYLNSEEIYATDIFVERYVDSRVSVDLNLKQGWNHLVLRFKKTRAGFGGIFGTWLGKLCYYFLMPLEPLENQEGFIFTAALKQPLDKIPGKTMEPDLSGLFIYPVQEWNAEQKGSGVFSRIFGASPNKVAVAYSHFEVDQDETLRIQGNHFGGMKIFLKDNLVYEKDGDSSFDLSIDLSTGLNDFFVIGECLSDKWGFTLKAWPSENSRLKNPLMQDESQDPWVYTGCFDPYHLPLLEELRDPNRLFQNLEGQSYWRLDSPGAWVRQYNDNPLFGHWNYPLGVTLYGLTSAAVSLDLEPVAAYVSSHVQKSIDTFDYALWDRDQFGGATAVHHLLSSIDSLDDCGSFGALLLEAASQLAIKNFEPIADYVAHYIKEEQIRLEDGTFFRKNLMHHFHEDTMWADDLYMSVPFLCRYYKLTGNRDYVEDAAAQFLGFKKRLFLEDEKLMCHVYDFKRNMPTGVPWGRGNGWVLFSLSELLAVLPKDSVHYDKLVDFFRTLSKGYLACQDTKGMWHQVLNRPDSYEETSCTAMFVYAFSRGVRYGWYENPRDYIEAAQKGWQALCRYSLDSDGNVHGVCRGSEFSFSPEYYMKELLWRLNDTHGIGIVILAGVEILKLESCLAEK